MPKELHDRLERQARKKGLSGKRKDAYVYGTMHRIEHPQGNEKPIGYGERIETVRLPYVDK